MKYPVSPQEHGLLKLCQTPSPSMSYNGGCLDEFMEWIVTDAMEYLRMNDGAKLVMDRLIAYHPIGDDLKVLNAFLQWLKDVSEGCTPNEKVQAMIDSFTTYRNQVQEYQEHINHAVRTYWLQ